MSDLDLTLAKLDKLVDDIEQQTPKTIAIPLIAWEAMQAYANALDCGHAYKLRRQIEDETGRIGASAREMQRAIRGNI